MQRIQLSFLKRILYSFFKQFTTRVVNVIPEIIIHIIVSGKSSLNINLFANICLTIFIPFPYRHFYKHIYYSKNLK